MEDGGFKMFKNLLAEMARNSIKKKVIASALGISERALSNKINGSSEFFWKEVYSIKILFFPELTVEYLFEKVGEKGAA